MSTNTTQPPNGGNPLYLTTAYPADPTDEYRLLAAARLLAEWLLENADRIIPPDDRQGDSGNGTA